MRDKLMGIQPQSASFWPTVTEFISYRSQMLASWQETKLPDCAEKPATGTGTVSQGIFTHGPLFYRNCKIMLDSPTTSVNLSTYLEIADVVFDHCVIFYDGNPIVIFPVKVAQDTPPKIVGNIHFNDCQFVFAVTKTPVPQGQQLIRVVLSTPNAIIQFQPETG